MTAPYRCVLASCLLVFLSHFGLPPAAAQENRNVVCVLPLEHAEAAKLAAVLAPLLSPNGTITAYPPTNTLVIKDKVAVVRMLIEAVKGRPDLSECANWKHGG